MFALIDCNNFYASCERAFQPSLKTLPVAVLSNNDGCVIARSNEVKALGVPMGAPAFKFKELFRKHGVRLFSALLQKIFAPHSVAGLDRLISTRACSVRDFCNRATLVMLATFGGAAHPAAASRTAAGQRAGRVRPSGRSVRPLPEALSSWSCVSPTARSRQVPSRCAPGRRARSRCAPERSAPSRCAPERWAPSRCAPESWAPSRCAHVRTAPSRCASQSWAPSRCACEDGFEVRSQEVGAFQVRSQEVGVFQVRYPEVGAFEVRSREVGAFQVRFPEVGAFEVRSPEVGAFEVRFLRSAPSRCASPRSAPSRCAPGGRRLASPSPQDQGVAPPLRPACAPSRHGARGR